MSTTKTSRLRRVASRVKEIYTELDYAQRRLWEVRTEPLQPRREEHLGLRASSKDRRGRLSGAASS
jgi:hypothetical protein